MQAFLKGGSVTTKPPQSGSDKPKKGKDGKAKPIPWIEKYRPRSVEDVAYQDEVISVLQKCIAGADLPNLLFYGPPGTGKTSTILAASRQLFGPELYKDRVLELNASDERGISVIRDKVKKFSQLTAAGTRSDGKPTPPFKIVILDEADSMTKDAQSALRRTMEKETKTTRFCLICNYVSRIIGPITSRCAKFRFKTLASDILTSRLKAICEAEGVAAEEEALDALLAASEGDMRRAIMYLQSASRLCGASQPESIMSGSTQTQMEEPGSITQDVIYNIAGVVPSDLVKKVIGTCSTDSYEELDKVVKNLILEGYAASQVLSQMFDHLVTMDTLSDKQKAVIFEKMAVTDKCLMDGADEYLQLMALFSTVMKQTCHGS